MLTRFLWRTIQGEVFILYQHISHVTKISLFSAQLKAHIRQQHGNMTRWHCGQCSKVMKSREALVIHVWHYHEPGHFEYTIADCHFTADTRSVVHMHQLAAHAPKKCSCKFRGCSKSFRADYVLALHERVHLGTKPFKCSWNECSFASAKRSDVKRHIRTKHFKLPNSLKEQNRRGIVDDRNPDDYIEVDQELMDRRLQ